MSLVETWLEENGYDYFGNAAEDTLIFFVHDENAPNACSQAGRSEEVIAGIASQQDTGTSSKV